MRKMFCAVLFCFGVAVPCFMSLNSVPETLLAEKKSKKQKKKKKAAQKKTKKSQVKKPISWPSTSNRSGYVTYRNCPYSCRSQGIPKSQCRDWKEANVCYVEDLRRSPGAGPVAVPLPDVPQNPVVDNPPGYGTIGERDQCLKQPGRFQSDPYVNIHKIRTSGGFFKSKYRVYGSVEGVCLSEAGYFESGRKRSDIKVQTSRSFKRFDFDLQFDKNKFPEIRVYTVHGRRAVIELDPNDYRSSNAGSIFGK